MQKKLDWDFIDTDRLIEKAYAAKTQKNYTCQQICIEEGELFFREREQQQIASLKQSEKTIIALGGGSLFNDNAQRLKSIGCLIYLKTPIDILWKRILSRGIPAYLDPIHPEKAFYETAKRRHPLYENSTDFIIETGQLSVEEIRDKILIIKESSNGK